MMFLDSLAAVYEQGDRGSIFYIVFTGSVKVLLNPKLIQFKFLVFSWTRVNGEFIDSHL